MKKINVFTVAAVMALSMVCPLAASSQTNGAWMTSPDGGMDHYAKTKRIDYGQADMNVYYKLCFRKDSTKINEYTEAQTVLMVSDKYTSFCDYNRLVNDSINDFMAASRKNARNAKAGQDWDTSLKKWKYYFVTLTDLENDRTTIQLYDVLRSYEFTYDRPTFDWHFEQGDTLINNTPCAKATCRYAGRDYIAWYAKNISMPYGPYLFGGLPGLIMEIRDTKDNWIFTNNGIENAKELRDVYLYDKKFINPIIKTTREKALAAYRNDVEDFANLSIEVFKVKKNVNGKWVTPDANEPRRPSNMLELEW